MRSLCLAWRRRELESRKESTSSSAFCLPMRAARARAKTCALSKAKGRAISKESAKIGIQNGSLSLGKKTFQGGGGATQQSRARDANLLPVGSCECVWTRNFGVPQMKDRLNDWLTWRNLNLARLARWRVSQQLAGQRASSRAHSFNQCCQFNSLVGSVAREWRWIRANLPQ